MLFMNPLLLFAALAAGGPLLIHLMLRNRPKRQVLPTLRFLPESALQTVAMHRLKNLLLLLLRVLVVLLIAAAFARPYLGASTVTEDRPRAEIGAVFAVDTSLSMRSGERWNKALESVRTQASRLPAGSPMALLFFDESARVAVEGATDLIALSAALEGAKPGYGGTNLVAAMRAGASLGMKQEAVRRTVYLISDFQRSGFQQVAEQVEIAEDVDFVMVPVGEGPLWNAAITGVSERDAETGRSIRVQLESFGTGSASGTLTLSRDGKAVETREIAFSDTGRRVEDIELNAELNEDCLLSAELTIRDGLKEDNRFTALIPGRVPLRVMVSAPGRRVLADNKGLGGYTDNPYLKAAVAAFGDHVEAAWIEPTRLAELSVEKHPVAIICGAESATPAILAHLKDYVIAGGNLILFPDGDSRQALPSEGAYPELCGVSVRGWKSTNRESGEYRLVTSHKTRNTLAGSEERDAAAHLYPRAYRYLEVGLPEGVEAVQALMRYDDASPFLVEHALGAGNVFLCTTSLDPRASDLVLRPTFSPFLHQLISECAERTTPRVAYHVGEVVQELLTAPQATLEPLDGGMVPDNGDDGIMKAPGAYRLRTGDLERVLAVRLRPEESDLASMEPSHIKVVGSAGTEAARVAGVNTETLESPPEPDAGGRFGHYLLVVALACMAAETLIASRTVR